MYFILFLSSFSLSSLFCAFFDFFKKDITEFNKTLQDYKDILPTVLVNIIVTYPIFLFLEYYFLLDINNKEVISYFDWITYFSSWYILADLFFYFCHRSLHHPRLYFLHKKHHKYKNPYGIGAIYCSIPEMIMANILSLFIPVYLLKIPESIIYFIILFSTTGTVLISHCNSQKINNKHSLHHKYFNCNYGLFISDRIFGTQKKM